MSEKNVKSAEVIADDVVSYLKQAMEEDRRRERPDYSNTVYCDRHLGVKMLLADTWTANEWSSPKKDAWADANPNFLWICPKPDCDRHYEPMMFGYHINEPGRRLDDAAKQPRGNHLERPFMYIGKEGPGRRYRCPLYKCDEAGDVVADSVVDEEVQLPPDPFTILKGAERKRALEMLVFLRFAAASGLPIDEGSPENRDPNYPDILCTISGQRHWFELGRIIHEEVAEKLNANQSKHVGGFSYNQEEPLVYVVTEKAKKNYNTENAPVDLILHFDPRFGSAATAQRLCEKNEALLKSLTTTGPFERVWVFDEFNKVVVWQR
jgi:hypothetical protein